MNVSEESWLCEAEKSVSTLRVDVMKATIFAHTTHCSFRLLNISQASTSGLAIGCHVMYCIFFSFYLLLGIRYQIMHLMAPCVSYFFSCPVFHSHLWIYYASHGIYVWLKMFPSFVNLLEPTVYLSAHINGPVLPKWVLVLLFIPLLTQFYWQR